MSVMSHLTSEASVRREIAVTHSKKAKCGLLQPAPSEPARLRVKVTHAIIFYSRFLRSLARGDPL